MALEIDVNGLFQDIIKEKKKDAKPEDVLYYVEDDFSSVIKKRGEDYYKNGKIEYCYKYNDKYIAKVKGYDDEYEVTFEKEVNEDSDEISYNYSCDCPCEFPCKHEYAVALAISGGEYTEKELKENISRINYNMLEIIKRVPAEELKAIMTTDEGINNYSFNYSFFEKAFIKYLPKQKYEYYYNNLYNDITIYGSSNKTNTYLLEAKSYIDSKEYIESFKILKAIIEVHKDLNKLSDELFTNKLSNIGMYLRISYRKGDTELKNTIEDWIKTLEEKDFSDNVYLEDVILTIK